MARLSVVAFLRQFIEEDDMAFVFDGATIALPETLNEFGNLLFTVTLTLGGTPIETNAYFSISSTNGTSAFGKQLDIITDGIGHVIRDSSDNVVEANVLYDPNLAPIEFQLVLEGAAGNWKIFIPLPSGGVVFSDVFVVEEPPPP
jgi:hypothetical protein